MSAIDTSGKWNVHRSSRDVVDLHGGKEQSRPHHDHRRSNRSGEQLAQMSGSGPSPTWCDVRDLVAISGKTDLTRTPSFGRD
jgi:hypothetical protein